MGSYHENLIIAHNNKDEQGNIIPQPILNEPQQILRNGYVSLNQVPHKPNRVTVNGYTEVDGTMILAQNQFWVDYNDAIVHFNISEVGKTVYINYLGTGQEFINARRVATEITEDGDIAKTLQEDRDEFIETSQQALEDFDTNSSNAILEFNNDGVDAIALFNTNGQNKINEIQTQTDTFLGQQEDRVDAKVLEVNNKITEVNTNMDNINTEFEQIKDDYDNATHVQMIKEDEGIFTATVDNTNSFILPTGFYNPLIDILYLEYDGVPLRKPKNYIQVGQEIDLQFYINTGEEIYFKVTKGVKDNPPVGADGTQLMEKSVPQSKLTDDVQDKLNFVADMESYGLAVLKENETTFIATVDNTTTFSLPVEFYNPITDIPELRYMGELLDRDKNYSISGYTVTLGWSINTGEKIHIRILKGSRRDIPMGSDGADIMNESIPLVKMTQDVQDKINHVDGIDGNLLLNSSVELTKLEEDVQDSINFIDTSKSKINNLPSDTNSSILNLSSKIDNLKLKDKFRYLMTTFNYNDMKLCLLGSNDGCNFKIIQDDAYAPLLGRKTLRDPSITQLGDYYYIVYTVIDWSTGSNIGMCRTKNFIDFEELAQITIGTFNKIWAPEFFIDGNNTHIIINATSDGVNFQSYIVDYNYNNHSISNLIQITGSNLPTNIIDSHIENINGTYYLFYKNEDTKYIEIAKSSSLTSNYHVFKFGNHAGWGNGIEGVYVVRLDNGDGYRIYFEEYSSNYIWYSDGYNRLNTWTDKKRVVFDNNKLYSHPTILDFNKNGNDNINKKNTDKIIHLLPLAVGGVIESLKVSNSYTYIILGSDNITINDIDISDLEQDDEISFIAMSDLVEGNILINKTSTVVLPYNYHIGKNTNSNELIVKFKVIKNNSGILELRSLTYIPNIT